MVEELIFYSFELPEEYLDELVAALAEPNINCQAEKVCGLIEKMNYKITDTESFLSAAAAAVTQLPEDVYPFFKRSAESALNSGELPERVKLFYGAML